MASVFYRELVSGFGQTNTLFEGTYEDCLDFFNKVKDEYLALNGEPEFHRTYEDSHKSIELSWSGSRLALKNWVYV